MVRIKLIRLYFPHCPMHHFLHPKALANHSIPHPCPIFFGVPLLLLLDSSILSILQYSQNSLIYPRHFTQHMPPPSQPLFPHFVSKPSYLRCSCNSLCYNLKSCHSLTIKTKMQPTSSMRTLSLVICLYINAIASVPHIITLPT